MFPVEQSVVEFVETSKKGNVKDALNTFYLWLYAIGHIVKNHSNNE